MTSQKSSRAKGDEIEDRVLHILGPAFKKTAGSGSVWKDGDLKAPGYLVEVKERNTAGASCAGPDLNKLISRARLEGRDWIFVCQNYNRKLVAMVDINTLAILLEEAQIAEELRYADEEQYQQHYEAIKLRER